MSGNERIWSRPGRSWKLTGITCCGQATLSGPPNLTVGRFIHTYRTATTTTTTLIGKERKEPTRGQSSDENHMMWLPTLMRHCHCVRTLQILPLITSSFADCPTTNNNDKYERHCYERIEPTTDQSSGENHTTVAVTVTPSGHLKHSTTRRIFCALPNDEQ